MHRNMFIDKQTQSAVWDDFVDFKIVLIDNGDDIVTLRIYLGLNKQLDISC